MSAQSLHVERVQTNSFVGQAVHHGGMEARIMKAHIVVSPVVNKHVHHMWRLRSWTCMSSRYKWAVVEVCAASCDSGLCNRRW